MFTLFTSKDLDHVMMPASVIRIAGGPDYFPKRSIKSIHCSPGSDETGNDISPSRAVSAELKHSRLKSDLVVHIMYQKPVIR